jgi:hypothetical protein
MALSSAQVAGGNAQVQARLDAYGAAVGACQRQPAATREACIAQARQRAGGSDDSDADDAVATPYLYFAGRAGCQIDVATRIDDRIEGAFADVQGQVAFTQTAQADYRHRDGGVCPLLQAVLDTRSGRLWTQITLSPSEPQGVVTRSEKGRKPQRTETAVPLQWLEAQGWVQERLTRLGVRGEDRVKLPAGAAAGARPDGQVEVQMRWRFEPV